MSDRTIYVTEQDMQQLRMLTRSVSTADSAHYLALSDELEWAEIVPHEAIPPNVVTINSKVVYEDMATGLKREIAIVLPEDAAPDQCRISVLAPLGAALIGLSANQEISWAMPDGKVLHLRVVEVTFQPEAAGRNAA